MTSTVDGSYLLQLGVTAGALGLDGAKILDEAGLAMSAELVNQRFDTGVLRTVCNALERDSGDPWIGLRLGAAAALDQGAVGVVRYACGASANVRDGLKRFGRYLQLVNQTGVFFTAETPEGSYLAGVRKRPGAEPHAVSVHFLLAAVYRAAQAMTDQQFTLSTVWLTEPAVEGKPVPDVFDGVTVRTGAVESALVVSPEVMRVQVHPPDAALSERLDQTAQKMIAALPQDDFGTRAKSAIIQLLADDPGLDAVATRLQLSPRTLQRRLKAEGLVHQELVEAVRQELSAGYLQEPTLSFTDIAFLLGYSDATAFSRAYKRWTGQSPSAARAALAKSS